MLIVTTNDLPGWDIQRVCGEVFGLTVRSRNAFSQMGAGFKAMFGGELAGMTKNLAESRNEAMGRLIAEARRGRFEAPEMQLVRPLMELQARWSALPPRICNLPNSSDRPMTC